MGSVVIVHTLEKSQPLPLALLLIYERTINSVAFLDSFTQYVVINNIQIAANHGMCKPAAPEVRWKRGVNNVSKYQPAAR